MKKLKIRAVMGRQTQYESKGITLISLVVTIIVLLILAGVSIALISSSNGILGKATASVDKTNIETAKEQVTLKIGEHQNDFYEGKYVTGTIDNQVKQGTWIYENYEGKTTDFEFTITLPENGEVTAENPYIVTIKKNRKLPGKVTGTLSLDGKLNWDETIIAGGEEELPENTPDTEAGTIVKTPGNWEAGYILGETDTAKREVVKVASVYAVSDGQGNTFPVPFGFWYVGGNFDTGIIISDNEADEFDGKVDKTTWEYSRNLQGNQFVFIPCSESEYHKTDWGIQSTNWDTTVDMAGKMQTQKYGGFYIGRYEAGLATTISEFTQTQIHTGSNPIYILEGIPQSKAGVVPWMFVDWNTAKTNSEKMYHTQYVTSGLITGTQWDVMLNKIIEKTDLTQSDMKSSEKWGNFADNRMDYKGRSAKFYWANEGYQEPFGEETEGTTTVKTQNNGDLLTTGASRQTEKYHLFDVAGNLWECTEETAFIGGNTAIQYRVYRGGGYTSEYSSYPACFRSGGYTVDENSPGYRFSSCTLYEVKKGHNLLLYHIL